MLAAMKEKEREKEKKVMEAGEDIKRLLKQIDVARLEKLAKSDGDFKAVLKLAEACKRSLAGKRKKKTSWLSAARALVKKIKSYDPLCINFIDKRRKDSTWCMWLRWDAMTERGTMSGYSLVSEHINSLMHEDAAKSFVEDFCHVGPDCLKIYSSPYTSERQRLANTAIVAVYKELGCPETAEEVKSKIFADH